MKIVMGREKHSWQRARKPEQKLFRREEILAAAETLFQTNEYENISLNAIAREAGISKPNIYRYFATREDIFLHLVLRSFENMLNYQEEHTADIAEDDVETFAARWIENSCKCTDFLSLAARIAPSMERYSSKKGLYDYKHELFPLMQKGMNVVVKRCPSVTERQAHTFILYSYALLAGLLSFISPSETLKEVMSMPEFDRYRINGMDIAVKALKALLRDMITR